MILNHGRKSHLLLRQIWHGLLSSQQRLSHPLPKVSCPASRPSWRVSTVHPLWKEAYMKMICSSCATPDFPQQALLVHDGHGNYPRSQGRDNSSVKAWILRSSGGLFFQKKYVDGSRSCCTAACGAYEIEAVEKNSQAEASFHTTFRGSNELILKRFREFGIGKNTIEKLVLRHQGEPAFSILGKKVELLLEGGFTVEQVRKLLSHKACRFFVRASYERVEFLLETLNKMKMSPGMILTKNIRAFGTRNEKLGIGLRFLKDLGLDEDSLAAAVMKNPSLVFKSLEHLPKSVAFLKGLGLDEESLAAAVMKYPSIVFKSSEHLQKSVAFLQEIGMDATRICVAIQKQPRILTLRIEGLKPRVAFWKSTGASTQEICKFICRCPGVLSLRTSEHLSQKISFLEKLGFKQKCVLRAASQGVFGRSLKQLLSRFEWMKGQGFSHEEAAFILRKQPSIFGAKQESLAKRIVFVISILGYDVKEILKVPAVLSASLEKKLIPRYHILSERKKNALLKQDHSLGTVTFCSDKKFRELLIRGIPSE